MIYLLYLVVGVIVGISLTLVVIGLNSGNGNFRLIPVEDEEGFYKVNVRLMPDQNLKKKKFIILSRE